VRTGNAHIDAAVAAGRVTLAVGPAARIAPPAPVPDGVSVVAYVKTPNPLNGRVHWRVQSRRVKAIHAAVWAALFDVPAAVRGRLATGCTVTMTRVSAGQVDSDNLQGCLKPVRDTVAVWLLDGAIGAMDSDPRISWECGQERGKRGVHCVRIEIEPR